MIRLIPGQELPLPEQAPTTYTPQPTEQQTYNTYQPQPLPVVSAEDMASKEWYDRNRPVDEMGTIGGLMETVDWLTGAPVRSALGSALGEGDRPFDAFKAGLSQFGKHPSTAPTGSQLAEKMGVSQRPLSDFAAGWEGIPTKAKLTDMVGLGIEATADVSPMLGLFGGMAAPGFKKGRQFSGLWDKKPRFEISDAKSKIKNYTESTPDYFKGKYTRGMSRENKLSDWLDHDELYENYPEIKDLPVEVHNIDWSHGAEGKYYLSDPEASFTVDENFKPIGIRVRTTNKEDLRSKLLHEIQHYIQLKEKHALGGSPKTSMSGGYRDRLADISDSKRHMEEYKRIAGEAEARDVSARMDLDEFEAAKTQPLESTGLKLEDLIVDMRGGGKNLSTGELQKLGGGLVDEAKKYDNADDFVGISAFSEGKDSKARNRVRKMLSKETELTPTGRLKPNSNNPKLDKSTIEIKQDLIESGEKPFILVDGNKIIDGHHSYEAYKNLGYDEVPTISKSQLTGIWKQANK